MCVNPELTAPHCARRHASRPADEGRCRMAKKSKKKDKKKNKKKK